MGDRKAFVVGISGASSSGKTTLARLLRDVFPNTFILHEDDFYKPETELPSKDGLLDWDCAESISIPDMARALAYIREHGTFPPFVDSKEDQNSIGACPVSDAAIAAAKAKVASWASPGQPGHSILHSRSSPLRICVLDGFLLYSPELEAGGVPALLDTKLFLLVSRERATQRRERRDGYVTLEGFWTDPPGYVDKIVWPNYVASHAGLFQGGDVEGKLDEKVLKEKGIEAQIGRGVDLDMEETFNWTVETVMRRLEEFGGKR
ncbi:P-loop containing nucleoside triphosphate hydrolase protein [Annulohypoxylon maeteangense]|uniref:P-loop containing nucleoside triphosphate hydrolase protein n=1 Tax=Annulohypoxylon maeteangense TaxID=1927788 RepID=UPI0020089EDC|nr:P-loop containing nucleoside triphosphate hydrolase protein [Annulohypoxylon maeteangense]KAI0884712.1 P-loop containing nucleoside triphosphate hydrolase protein [Annulohypoxylon maeteangense]